MTVRDLIQKLLTECKDLDKEIDVYVSADESTVKERAANDAPFDDFVGIRKIDETYSHYYMYLDMIEG